MTRKCQKSDGRAGGFFEKIENSPNFENKVKISKEKNVMHKKYFKNTIQKNTLKLNLCKFCKNKI